jgi:hypothetical protein
VSAATLAEIRTKSAIKDYEEQTGIQVSGNARLEEMFAHLSQIYLVHATLGEMRFRKTLPSASAMTCAAGIAAH